jgi:hypothetical protein
VGYFFRLSWLLLTLLLSVLPDFRACDNPFVWVKDNKNRANTGSCSFQDPFRLGILSGFSEKNPEASGLEIHKP